MPHSQASTSQREMQSYGSMDLPPRYSINIHDETEDFREIKRGDDQDMQPSLIPTFAIDSEPASNDVRPDDAQDCPLTRGLQVPSRITYITSGFKYPSILHMAGITLDEWKAFTSQVKSHASLSIKQWTVTVGSGLGLSLIGIPALGFVALVPVGLLGHKMRKKQEHRNFRRADEDGFLSQCVEQWNVSLFNAKGLAVRVDIPGNVNGMANMDVSSTKLFKYRQKSDLGLSRFGLTDEGAQGKKVRRYQKKEGRARRKAALKGRIVIIPMFQEGPLLREPSKLPTYAALREDES